MSLLRSGKVALAALIVASMPGLASAGYWDSNDGDTGGYVEMGYVWNSVSDIESEYRGSDAIGVTGVTHGMQTWDVDANGGGKVQIGQDWGKIRFDLKMEGNTVDLEKIGPSAAKHTRGYRAAMGLNLYWDIYRLGFGEFGMFSPAVTPYVGFGAGGAAMYLEGNKGETGANTSTQKDSHALSGGPMVSGSAGLLLDITESLGATVGYDYEHVYAVGHRRDDHNNHALSAGLRVTF